MQQSKVSVKYSEENSVFGKVSYYLLFEFVWEGVGWGWTLIRGWAFITSQEERFHFGVFSEKLKLTKSSVPSLITFNCDIKFPKGFLSL